MANSSSLTVKQAAAGLGVSPKTIRRRIGEGALSATKELRGKQEIVLIDGSELARYAEVANLRLDLTRVGQGGTGTEDEDGPQGPQLALAGTPDPDSPKIEELDNRGNDGPGEAILRQVQTLEDTIRELRQALVEGKQREAWLQERIEASEAAAVREREMATEERRRLLELIPKALPPAPPWWQRMFGRKDATQQQHPEKG